MKKMRHKIKGKFYPVNNPLKKSGKNLTKILFFCLSGMMVPVLADTTDVIQSPSIQETSTQVQSSVEDSITVNEEAKQWGLTVQAWQHYHWIMNNTPSARWYKTLDPAEVLALNTTDSRDMMQYALIQARNMHERVSQELAFNKIYAQAYQTLYPNEKPISSSTIKQSIGATLQAGDHIWLFVGVNTPLGRFVYQHLIQSVQTTPNAVLDIYFVGQDLSPQSIETWAQSSGIQPAMINQQVTLNEGNQRFSEVSQGKNQDLPLVGVVRNNQFQPISLSSVL